MKCPFCSSDDTQVKDSRPAEDNAAIRRRRVCNACEARFTTFERVQLREIIVIKEDGRKEVFDREKMLRSLRLPLQKRPVEMDEIEKVTNQIVRNIETSGENEITSVRIGEHVMAALSGLDPIAYVRYASVYKDFREVSDFNQFLDGLKEQAKKKRAS